MMRRATPLMLLLILSLLALPGCELVGGVLAGFTGAAGVRRVKKTYALPEKPTAVMVDAQREPGVVNVLDNPTMRSIIATDAVYFMSKGKALGGEAFVPVKQVNRLEAELGRDYPTTPIDEFGRRLGAKQVIYILIDSATIEVGSGLYQPKAQLQIKVIDVEAGTRLFPDPAKLSDEGAGPPGFPLQVEMPTETMEGTTATVHEAMSRKLAHEVGLKIGRLFYDSTEPTSGL